MTIKQIFSGIQKQTYGIMTEIHYIFLTMRTRLFWQNHTAIKPIITVFIVLLYSSILSAFDITLSSPSNVELNESFDVSISSENTQKTFDIKIYVHNSPDDKIARNEIISYISDGNVWKDSYLYIINSYPSNKEYQMKLDTFSYSSL